MSKMRDFFGQELNLNDAVVVSNYDIYLIEGEIVSFDENRVNVKVSYGEVNAESHEIINVNELKRINQVIKEVHQSLVQAVTTDIFDMKLNHNDKIIIGTVYGFEISHVKELHLDHLICLSGGRNVKFSYGNVINVNVLNSINPEFFL